jgi:hypothetical protein
VAGKSISALGQAEFRRLNRQIAGPHALLDDVPLANPGAFLYPLVVGRDHLFQIVVRQQLGRNVNPYGSYLGTYRQLRLQRQTQILHLTKQRFTEYKTSLFEAFPSRLANPPW